MTDPSAVRFACDGDCGYTTLIYPESPKQREQWRCGYDLPDLACPECAVEEDGLGDLFGETAPTLTVSADQSGTAVEVD